MPSSCIAWPKAQLIPSPLFLFRTLVVSKVINRLLSAQQKLLHIGSVTQTVTSISISDDTISSRSHRSTCRNSYTVEFAENDWRGPSLGYVHSLIEHHRGEWCAIIQRLQSVSDLRGNTRKAICQILHWNMETSRHF